MKNILITLFFLFKGTSVFAKFETTIVEKSFGTATKVVIDEEQIKSSKASSVGSLLATQANITIANSAFQPNSLFLRGGDSGQVLILVDGVPVYDPSTIQRSFNLNSLNVKSIKKITVIKGSQSVWYGGQALTAVIKIDTLPSASESPVSTQVATGSSDDKDFSGSANYQIHENHFLFFRGNILTQSQLSPVDNSNFRYVKRKNNLETGYLSFNESKFYIKVNQYSDRNENVTGISQFDFAAADTIDFITTNDSQQFLLSYSDSTVALKPLFSLGVLQTQRQFNYGLSEYNATEENQVYKGRIIPIRGELRLINASDFRWDIGASYQKENMLYEEFKVEQSNTSNEIKGLFSKWEYDLYPSTLINLGVRRDADLLYPQATTYQIGFTYNNYKMEYATGFKLPSLYHLYSNKGNTNLSSEFARSYTLSADYDLSQSLKASFTLFETHIENQIAAKGNPMQYYNIGRTQTKGIESAFAFLMSPSEVIKFSVAYQEPRDVNTGKWLSKRPLQSGSASYLRKMQDASLTFEIIGRGERLDSKSVFETISLPGYALLNTAYIYFLNESSEIFFRGNNLLNQKYQETYGYLNRGFDFQAGFSYSL